MQIKRVRNQVAPADPPLSFQEHLVLWLSVRAMPKILIVGSVSLHGVQSGNSHESPAMKRS
jgi:hypothetical protein